MNLYYDLHIHSCLSPCGDDDMTPANIVGMAALKGLELIAVTDHNSCKNCPAVMELAAEYGLLAIPGMELTTSEEVHVLCLFPSLSQALAFDDYVHQHLFAIANKEHIFGKQQIYNAQDICIDSEPLLLINSTRISIDALYPLITSFEGVMIPAHIEKNANSLLCNLGFVPPDSKFTVVELKDPTLLPTLCAQNPYLTQCNVLCNSDAHYLQDIKEPNEVLTVTEKSIAAVLHALQNGTIF
ncbi:MAG: PHP domain-containing protein [Faecalibacterium sp.]